MIKKHLPKSWIVLENRLTRLLEEPRASARGDEVDQQDAPVWGFSFWGSKGLGIRVLGFKAVLGYLVGMFRANYLVPLLSSSLLL